MAISPAKILCELNRIYNQEFYFLEDGVYFTIFFGLLNTKNNMLKYASAGHHAFPLIMNTNNEITELQEIDLAIGFVDDFNYEEHELQLGKNNRIFLHTDGIIEISNNKGE